MSSGKSVGFTPWRAREAAVFVRKLQIEVQKVGWHTGITGSVLQKGNSDNDLDLILYPHVQTAGDYDGLVGCLGTFGLVRLFTSEDVARHWKEKGSLDTKHVEVWVDRDKHKIDMFILK